MRQFGLDRHRAPVDFGRIVIGRTEKSFDPQPVELDDLDHRIARSDPFAGMTKDVGDDAVEGGDGFGGGAMLSVRGLDFGPFCVAF